MVGRSSGDGDVRREARDGRKLGVVDVSTGSSNSGG